MCLLITSPANAPHLTREWVEDFYSSNADGVGVMYAKDGEVVVHKSLPYNTDEAFKFIDQHANGRECAIHFRMATHGKTDLLNCHPYEVFPNDHEEGGLYLMHNGVLSTGNRSDLTKSDTWHYINHTLRPLLAGNREMLFNPAFQALVGREIGSSNKFVLVNFDGRTVTINRHVGVTWGGRWMSNEYAWTNPTLYLKPNEATGLTAEAIARMDVEKGPEDRGWRSGDPRMHENSYWNTGSYQGSSYKKGSSQKKFGGALTPSQVASLFEDDEDDHDAQDTLFTTAGEINDYIVDAGFGQALDGLAFIDIAGFIEEAGEDFAWQLVDMLEAGQISNHRFGVYVQNPQDAIEDLDPDGLIAKEDPNSVEVVGVDVDDEGDDMDEEIAEQLNRQITLTDRTIATPKFDG